jgi:hypothetical protein
MVCHDVRKCTDEQVAEYKKLRGEVQVIDDIPWITMGKVIKWKLSARVENKKEMMVKL